MKIVVETDVDKLVHGMYAAGFISSPISSTRLCKDASITRALQLWADKFFAQDVSIVSWDHDQVVLKPSLALR